MYYVYTHTHTHTQTQTHTHTHTRETCKSGFYALATGTEKCTSSDPFPDGFYRKNCTVTRVALDGKPGLVPGLVPGIQGCKTPGSLGQPWDQTKSFKFILIDSNFLLSPCPEHPVTQDVSPSFPKDFLQGKKIFLETPSPGLPRGKGDGGCKRVPLSCPKL